MHNKQILTTNLDQLYRIGAQANQQAPAEKTDKSFQDIDAAIEEKIHHALWKDDVLRVTDHKEINVKVINRIAYLSGHLLGTTNLQRVEKALQTVDGIHGIHSNMVMDDELKQVVATALGPLEQLDHCKFFTGVSHGVVVLNGKVSSMQVRLLAEQCAASHPSVRGVINYIRVLGIDLDAEDQRLIQPPIGKEISFRDGVSGIIRQVVINPDNRRVISMIIQGHIYDSYRNLPLSNNSTAQAIEQCIVIPVSVIGHLTNNSGFLTIRSTDYARFQEFDDSLFSAPAREWVPPYPYCHDDVLFPVENQPGQTSPIPETEDQILSEELLANDSLGG